MCVCASFPSGGARSPTPAYNRHTTPTSPFSLFQGCSNLLHSSFSPALSSPLFYTTPPTLTLFLFAIAFLC